MIVGADFAAFLKKKGKKQDVIDSIVADVALFEQFLRNIRSKSIEETDTDDILRFVDACGKGGNLLSKKLRSIALYFGFLSKPSLAALASEFREREISAKRKALRLDQISNCDRTIVDKLAKAGIVNTYQMIEAARSAELRENLAAHTGIEMERILEYLKLSDLSRLKGMKGVRVRLYYDAGVDTLDKLSSWDPEELRKMLIDFVRRTSFEGIPPLPKEVSTTIEAAKKLERLIDF
jgi:site-specific recombinase XerD